jgi:serine/threonine-protein kinase RsbW
MTRWDLSPKLFGAVAFGTITSGHDRAPARAASPRGSAAITERPHFMITLTVPGALLYRQLVLRVVESSCKLARARLRPGQEQKRNEFDDEVVSAFSEAFNNVAIHGYAGRAGDVRVEIECEQDGLTIRMFDIGRSFDPSEIGKPPAEELPESGMGLYIIHSFMDRVSYLPGDPPGTPNLLVLHKRLRRGASTPPDAPKENAT